MIDAFGLRWAEAELQVVDSTPGWMSEGVARTRARTLGLDPPGVFFET